MVSAAHSVVYNTAYSSPQQAELFAVLMAFHLHFASPINLFTGSHCVFTETCAIPTAVISQSDAELFSLFTELQQVLVSRTLLLC